MRRPDPLAVARGVVLLLGLAVVARAPVAAHPGSGIEVDRQGRIFFVDTGEGVWVVETDGRVRKHDGPAFHWMTLDRASAFGEVRFAHGAMSDMRAVGRDPMVILSSDFPLVVGSDGALYWPEPGADRRLHLVRLAPTGERSDRAILPAESDGRPLQWLNGLASGPDGSLYYAENAAVRRIDARGAIATVASAVAVPDCDAMPNVPADFGPYLRGLAVAADGAVFVTANGCRAVLRIDPAGAVTVVLRAEAPWSPTAVAVHDDDVYVLEYTHTVDDPPDRRVWVPRVRMVAPDGSVKTLVAVTRSSP